MLQLRELQTYQNHEIQKLHHLQVATQFVSQYIFMYKVPTFPNSTIRHKEVSKLQTPLDLDVGRVHRTMRALQLRVYQFPKPAIALQVVKQLRTSTFNVPIK